jgi:hypothetical protein
MFWPHLAILRQLLTFQNRHTALVLKLKYFNGIAYFVFHFRDIHLTSGNIHTKGAHGNKNDNNTISMFIRLNKTTQKHGRRKRKIALEWIKSYVLKQMHFSVNDEICNSTEIF